MMMIKKHTDLFFSRIQSKSSQPTNFQGTNKIKLRFDNNARQDLLKKIHNTQDNVPTFQSTHTHTPNANVVRKNKANRTKKFWITYPYTQYKCCSVQSSIADQFVVPTPIITPNTNVVRKNKANRTKKFSMFFPVVI